MLLTLSIQVSRDCIRMSLSRVDPVQRLFQRVRIKVANVQFRPGQPNIAGPEPEPVHIFAETLTQNLNRFDLQVSSVRGSTPI